MSIREETVELEELNSVMLPGTLEDCFEMYREQLLCAVCKPQLEDRLNWLLHEIRTLRKETDAIIGFSDIFDPFLGVPHGLSKLPIGTTVAVPAMPSTIIASLPVTAPLRRIAAEETYRLSSQMSNYETEEIALLCKVAKAGYADENELPADREQMLYYAASNGSKLVVDYLIGNSAVLRSVPYRSITFPPLVEQARTDLKDFFAEHQEQLFSIERSLRCYTDEEIRVLTLDARTLFRSPGVRHFGACNQCLNRLFEWQQTLREFQELEIQKREIPGQIDA